ncbi:protein FAM162A-like [Penaeus japonicus]|uniref:protein FAM162A-like n=1 Tax=Penaeus japonicus TaxID=27405 RepID=UPI001C70D94E|nr:protein FAM162A-like [Penaeus japonicus]
MSVFIMGFKIAFIKPHLPDKYQLIPLAHFQRLVFLMPVLGENGPSTALFFGFFGDSEDLLKGQNSRVFGSSIGLRPYSTEGEVKDVVKKETPSPAAPKGNIGLRDHRINKFEKFLMVWGGKYKTMDEVPDFVSQDSLERARNKARIKINLLMGLATLIGCFFMIWSGKKAQKEGQSLVKMNEEWHKKMKADAEKAKGDLEAAKAS